MRTIFRATAPFLHEVRRDLAHRHPFAAERVGFISVRAAHTRSNLIVLAERYYPVADDDYVDDPTVGAMMGQEAIRKALDIALLQPVGVFHVHMHEHRGRPGSAARTCTSNLNLFPTFSRYAVTCPMARSCSAMIGRRGGYG